MAHHRTGAFIYFWHLIWAALVSVAFAPARAQQVQNNPERLIAYYGMWTKPSYTASSIPFETVKLTHVMHAFLWLDKEGNLFYPVAPLGSAPITVPDPDRTLLITRAHHHKAKVLISIGGGGKFMAEQADAFHEVASTAKTRENFVKAVTTFVRANNYDGVDIDWEVPEENEKQKDALNCVLLMSQLRDALHTLGNGFRPTRHLLLSMAVPQDPRAWGGGLLNPIDPTRGLDQLIGSVDFLNVMTYDLHNCSSTHIGHNAPLDAHPDDPHDGRFSLRSSMALYKQTWRISETKLNFGMPLYGYRFTGSGVNSLGATYTKPPHTCKEIFYAAVISELAESDWERHHDPQQGGSPYLVRKDLRNSSPTTILNRRRQKSPPSCENTWAAYSFGTSARTTTREQRSTRWSKPLTNWYILGRNRTREARLVFGQAKAPGRRPWSSQFVYREKHLARVKLQALPVSSAGGSFKCVIWIEDDEHQRPSRTA